MAKETITFRIEGEKRAALDAIAETISRSRSFVLSEAIDAYLDVNGWQIEHILESVRQADAGEFASEEAVCNAFRRWRSER